MPTNDDYVPRRAPPPAPPAYVPIPNTPSEAELLADLRTLEAARVVREFPPLEG